MNWCLLNVFVVEIVSTPLFGLSLPADKYKNVFYFIAHFLANSYLFSKWHCQLIWVSLITVVKHHISPVSTPWPSINHKRASAPTVAPPNGTTNLHPAKGMSIFFCYPFFLSAVMRDARLCNWRISSPLVFPTNHRHGVLY